MTVVTQGPTITLLPKQRPPVLGSRLEPGEELSPCRFCGSTGVCEHLVGVIRLEGRPVGVCAEMGAEAGRRRLQELFHALILAWLKGQGGL
jgi:hypothetical protein